MACLTFSSSLAPRNPGRLCLAGPLECTAALAGRPVRRAPAQPGCRSGCARGSTGPLRQAGLHARQPAPGPLITAMARDTSYMEQRLKVLGELVAVILVGDVAAVQRGVEAHRHPS